MIKKANSFFNPFLIFITVFSFFNDSFLVERFGENILKVIFLLFIAFNSKAIFRNLISTKTIDYRLFKIFYVLLLISFLIQILLNRISNVFTAAFPLVYVFTIITFFQSYDIKKLSYFIWLSVMVSVVICFFNQPISEWTFRTTGGTGDVNEYATHLLIFILTSIYLFRLNKSLPFLAISVIFFLYGFFKAGSMSAFLVLGVIILIILWHLKKELMKDILSFKGFFLLIGLTILIFTFNIGNSTAVKNVLNRTQNTHTSDTRMNSWVAGANMIKQNPILGVGLDNYQFYTRDYAEVYLTDDSVASHNLYVELFAESGLIVGMSFMALILYLVVYGFRKDDFFWIWLSYIAILLMGLTLGLIYDKYCILMIAIAMNILYESSKTSVLFAKI